MERSIGAMNSICGFGKREGPGWGSTCVDNALRPVFKLQADQCRVVCFGIFHPIRVQIGAIYQSVQLRTDLYFSKQ